MVDVIPTLQALKPQDVAGRVAVVIDVLRATSTIVAALAAGAREIRPASSPAEARARLARLAAARGGRDGLVLGGERLGLRIEGFDLGNSPLEYTAGAVGGKTVFFTTTNGTRTLRRAAGRRAAAAGGAPSASPAPGPDGAVPVTGPGPAKAVYVAAFLNATAVAERLLATEDSVVMACAGTRGGFSLEDVLLAGFLVDRLERSARAARAESPGAAPTIFFRDLARAGAALYRHLAGPDGENLARVIVTADHARYLTGLGFGADVAYCASLDLTRVVPEYRHGRVKIRP